MVAKGIDNYTDQQEHGSDLRSKMSDFKDSVSNMTDKFKENAKEKLSHSADEIREKFDDMHKCTVNCIKDNPLLCVGIALVAGMVLGSIVRR